MKRASLLSLFIIILLQTSCDFGGERIEGNGKQKTVTRNIKRTEKIRVQGSVDVFVEAGAPGVRVEADENIIPLIETEMDNNWLEIKTKDNFNINTNNPIKVYISTETISGLTINGSGNITCNDKFTSNKKITLRVTGSGDMIADINAPAVDAEVTGSGNIDVKGETKDVELVINGSGNYNGAELKAENATIKILGSGNADVFADYSLKAHISGSGDIKYKGNANVNKRIAGSGSVIKIE
jgi:hypothetical protein